jgi:hypothetical protein
MKEDMKAKITFGVWGLAIGAVIAMIIGFSWGGWTTSATAHKMSTEAVVESQAAICVAQFMKEANSQEKLKEFEKVESYNRSEFIEKGGWTRMPGQKEAGSGVAMACVTGIEALIKK